ncbi:MAG: flippase-like domain-containing protein [Bellilinea sp.]|nr:flippase-like domain-containing protein [Bellilinea sp.]
MRLKLSNVKWIWAIWLAAIFLLGWSLKSTPVEDIFRLLGRLHLSQLLLLIGVNALVLLLISMRWQTILLAMGVKLPLNKILSYRLTSFGISYFTPGPQFGGEPAQVAFLTRNHPVHSVNAISSVYLDKLLELLVNFLIIASGMLLILNSGIQNAELNYSNTAPLLFLGLIPVAHLIALRINRFPFKRMVKGTGLIHSKVEWIKNTGRLMVEAEERIAEFLQKHPQSLYLAIAVSMFSWGMMILEYFLITRFLGLELTISQVIFAFVLSRLAFLAPLPAGLGVLEASQVFAMQTIGLPAASGLALSMWMRARDVVIGLLGLGLGGWTLTRTKRSLQREV